MMNVKDLTKEQKQYIALGSIVAVAFVVIIVFGIKVSLSSISDAKMELNEFSDKIENAERALSKQDRIRKDFAETTQGLRGFLKDTPPNRNYYSWAMEIIYAKARMAGLEIDAIDEQARAGVPPSGAAGQPLVLESYSLRINALGSYEQLKGFLELIERDHPMARVVSVDISTGQGPETHGMQLVVQWPFSMNSVTEGWTTIDAKQQIAENPVSTIDDSAREESKKVPPPPPPRPGSSVVQPEESKE